MKEKLKAEEAKVIDLCFNALHHITHKLDEEKTLNRPHEVEALEKAVLLCHKIRSLLPVD